MDFKFKIGDIVYICENGSRLKPYACTGWCNAMDQFVNDGRAYKIGSVHTTLNGRPYYTFEFSAAEFSWNEAEGHYDYDAQDFEWDERCLSKERPTDEIPCVSAMTITELFGGGK